MDLDVLKKQHNQEMIKQKIDIEERDNRIEIMLNLMKNNDSKSKTLIQENLGGEVMSESELKGDLETVKQRLREAKSKIRRLNKELDQKVARINELEDNVIGHVEDKRCTK